MMDPTYAAAQADGAGDPTTGLSIVIMLVGIFIVSCAALAEACSGRSNIITRALDRWSK